MDCQGARKTQKEGQECQGEVKELGRSPLAVVRYPGHPGLPSGFSWAPWQSIMLCLSGSCKNQALRQDCLNQAGLLNADLMQVDQIVNVSHAEYFHRAPVLCVTVLILFKLQTTLLFSTLWAQWLYIISGDRVSFL